MSQKVTPKEAQVKIASLLKGIDNSMLDIKSYNVEIKKLVPCLTAAKPTPVKAVKPEKAAKVAKPVKPVKVAKVAKPEKAVKPVKVAKAAVKSEKAAKPVKAAVANRPTAKDAAQEVLTASGTALSANDIYKQAVTKWGSWSRQAFYKVLENKKVFQQTDSGYVLVKKDAKDSDELDAVADKIVEKAVVAGGDSDIVADVL